MNEKMKILNGWKKWIKENMKNVKKESLKEMKIE